MPIRLSSQTQRQQAPSAAAYGVGLPTTDGGAGAVSRALGSLAGSASSISSTLQQRKDRVQKQEDLVQKSAAARRKATITLDLDAQESKIKELIKLGKSEEANRRTQELLDYAKQIDPNGELYTGEKDPQLNDSYSSQLRSEMMEYATRKSFGLKEANVFGMTLNELESTTAPATESVKNIVTSNAEGRAAGFADLRGVFTTHDMSRNSEVFAANSDSTEIMEDYSKSVTSQMSDGVEAFVESQMNNPDILQRKAGLDYAKTMLGTYGGMYDQDTVTNLVEDIDKKMKEVIKAPDLSATTDLATNNLATAFNSEGLLTQASENALKESYAHLSYTIQEPNISKADLKKVEGQMETIRTTLSLSDPAMVRGLVSWREANSVDDVGVFLNKRDVMEAMGRDKALAEVLSPENFNKVRGFANQLITKYNEAEQQFGETGVNAMLDQSTDAQKYAYAAILQFALDAESQVDQRQIDQVKEAYASRNTGSTTDYMLLPELTKVLSDPNLDHRTLTNAAALFVGVEGSFKAHTFLSEAASMGNETAQELAIVVMAEATGGHKHALTVAKQMEEGRNVGTDSSIQKTLGSSAYVFKETYAYSTTEEYREDLPTFSPLNIPQALEQSGQRNAARLYDLRIKGMVSEQVQSGVTDPEQIWENVDKQLSDEMSQIQDSNGNPVFLMQGYGNSSKMGYTKWPMFSSKITREQHADVRVYSSMKYVTEEMGVSVPALLIASTYSDKAVEGNDVMAEVQKELKSRRTEEEVVEYLLSEGANGRPLLKPTATPSVTKKGEPAQTFQVYNARKGTYEMLKDSKGDIITIPLSYIDSMSNQDGVREMQGTKKHIDRIKRNIYEATHDTRGDFLTYEYTN